MKYEFQREDNGETVEVDFETNMSQDAAGYVTLADGARARRCNREFAGRTEYAPQRAVPLPVINDMELSVGEHEVEAARLEARQLGFTGIEFRPNPDDPEDFVCVASSRKEMLDYARRLGYREMSKRSVGATDDPALIERGKAAILRRFEHIK